MVEIVHIVEGNKPKFTISPGGEFIKIQAS